MNTRTLLAAAIGLTAMLGGIASASAETPMAPRADVTATARAHEGKVIRAHVVKRHVRHERRLAMKRGGETRRVAEVRAAHKEAKTVRRVG